MFIFVLSSVILAQGKGIFMFVLIHRCPGEGDMPWAATWSAACWRRTCERPCSCTCFPFCIPHWNWWLINRLRILSRKTDYNAGGNKASAYFVMLKVWWCNFYDKNDPWKKQDYFHLKKERSAGEKRIM